MRLNESLFESVGVEEPAFDVIEGKLLDIPGTTKVEFDYRPNDGVYKVPQDHFIVLVFTDNDFGDGLEWFKNRRTWKLSVIETLKKLGWKLEDPLEDDDSYIYLVMQRIQPQKVVKEGFEYLDGTKVEVYSNYHKALSRAKELGLKESEYGDEYGSGISYCCWNESGDRNETEKVIAYYVFENGKPKALDATQRERLEHEKEFTFDDELKESLNEDDNSNATKVDFEKLFDEYMEKDTYYRKDGGYWDVEMYADYRDELSDKDILKILDSSDPRQTFEEMLWDAYSSVDWEYRKDIESGFKSYLEKNDVEYDEDDLDSWLEDNFYELVAIYPDYGHFEKQEVKVLLMVDGGDANYDYSLNPNYYTNYGRDELSDEAGIVWLVEQQGHTKEELVKALDEEQSDNAFMNSVVEECFNTTSSLNAVTFFGRCQLGDLLNYADSDSILVKKEAMCGLVDTWYGGGSILEIKLEKDVIVPSRNVGYFGPDGGKGYSVDSIYGLSGSAWLSDAFVIQPIQQQTTECVHPQVEVKNEALMSEKWWTAKVPNELAKKFHDAINSDSDDLIEVQQAIADICAWLEEEYPDLEWELQEIYDAWDLVDLNDRYADFDPDADPDEEERTNEDYVNEEIISVLYDILDANDIWMPLEHEITEEVNAIIEPKDNMVALKELASEMGVEILSSMQNGDLRLSGSGESLMKFYQEAEKRGLWKVEEVKE